MRQISLISIGIGTFILAVALMIASYQDAYGKPEPAKPAKPRKSSLRNKKDTDMFR